MGPSAQMKTRILMASIDLYALANQENGEGRRTLMSLSDALVAVLWQYERLPDDAKDPPPSYRDLLIQETNKYLGLEK